MPNIIEVTEANKLGKDNKPTSPDVYVGLSQNKSKSLFDQEKNPLPHPWYLFLTVLLFIGLIALNVYVGIYIPKAEAKGTKGGPSIVLALLSISAIFLFYKNNVLNVKDNIKYLKAAKKERKK